MNRRDVALLVIMALLFIGLTMIGDSVDVIRAGVERMGAGEGEYGVTVFEDGSVVWDNEFGSGWLCLPEHPCSYGDAAFEEYPR